MKTSQHLHVRAFTTTVCLCLLAAVLSCQRESAPLVAPRSVDTLMDPVLGRLLARGISMDRIEDQDSVYVLDGDIVFRKQGDSSPGSRQKIQPEETVVSITYIGSVSVAVDNSFPRVAWRQNVVDGLQDAIASWNGIPNTKLHFFYTEDLINADIVVRNNPGLSSNNYGQTRLSAGCLAGNDLALNNLTELLRRQQLHFLIAHELGHAIGYLHTDESGTNLTDFIKVPGTPLVDASSLLNKGTYSTTSNPANVPNWTNFSQFDIAATQFIYPLGVVSAKAVYDGGADRIDFTWPNSAFCSPMQTIQMTLPNGNYSQQVMTKNTGIYTFEPIVTGTYKIRVFDNSRVLEATIIY